MTHSSDNCQSGCSGDCDISSDSRSYSDSDSGGTKGNDGGGYTGSSWYYSGNCGSAGAGGCHTGSLSGNGGCQSNGQNGGQSSTDARCNGYWNRYGAGACS